MTKERILETIHKHERSAWAEVIKARHFNHVSKREGIDIRVEKDELDKLEYAHKSLESLLKEVSK